MNNNEWILFYIIAIEFAVQIGASIAIISWLIDIYKELKKK